MKVCAHYDPSVDAATIIFRPRVKSVRTVDLDEQRFIDYDAEDRVAFVELLDVSDGVRLAGLPEPATIRRELEAIARSNHMGEVVIDD